MKTRPLLLKTTFLCVDFLQNSRMKSTRIHTSPHCALLNFQPFGFELGVENLRQAPPEFLQDQPLGQALREILLLRLFSSSQQTGTRGLHHLPGDAGQSPVRTDPRNPVVNSPGAFTHVLQPRGHACHGILKTVTVTSSVVFIILGTTDCDNIRITFRRKI